MSMLWYDMKQSKRWIFGWLIAALAFFAICISAVAVWSQTSNPNRELVGEDGSPKIGLAMYTTGTFEVFDCLAEGTTCPEFASAQQTLEDMSSSFTYSPLPGVESPGKSAAEGSKTVTLDELSDAEWQQVGASVMRDGDVTMGVVQPENVNIADSQGVVKIPESGRFPAVQATVKFEYSGKPEAPEDVRVLSVTYSESG